MKFPRCTHIAVAMSISLIAGGCFDAAAPESPSATADEPPKNEQSSKANSPTAPLDGFSQYVDKEGSISLPAAYKQNWMHLGSWAVSKKVGESPHEIHDVYTQPESVAGYNKTGEFPDGTVLVKEVRHTKTDDLTTGHAAWSSDVKIWFVMIKDREGRFEDSDHWGDGWGWALFEAKDPTKNVSAGYETSCLSCHEPVEDTDWVYTYGYPSLKQPE